MTKEDLKTFATNATNATADLKETLLHQYRPAAIESYPAAGTEAADRWE
jgi:hypothetical protein